MVLGAAERLESLREQIRFHAHRYYVLDDPVIADGEATTVELNSALQVEIGQRTEEEAFVAQGDIGPHIPVDSSLSVSQIQAEIVFVEVTASDETPDACQSLSKLPVGLEEQVRVQETRNASISTCCFF